jgi:hypothetical protein
MPLPQIRDGHKLSLVLPADVIRRLKVEAMEGGTIPALIVLEALDQYWDGNNGASDPTTAAKDPRQRSTLTHLLEHLEALVADGKLTLGEIAKAAGVATEQITTSWRNSGYVPASCGRAVALLLQSKQLL